MRRAVASVAALVLASSIGGQAGPVLAQESPGPGAAMTTGPADGIIPDELVLGLVPSREADVLIENARPLADHLSSVLGIPVESYVPTDYTGLVVAMQTGQAHIGAFGPFALIQAQDVAGAEIILQSVRRGSTSYHTQWMTNDPVTFCEDEPVADEAGLMYCNGTLEATEGPVGEAALARIPASAPVSFTEQSSASGYIFPAVQLINAGIDPDSDITPIFSGGHDNSVIAVCNGDALAAVSFDDARTILKEGDCADMSKVVVFAYSGEIPNDGVAVAGDLDPTLRQAIADALIAYSQTDEGRMVLGSVYEIDEFVPADLAAFDIVREAAEKVGAPE